MLVNCRARLCKFILPEGGILDFFLCLFVFSFIQSFLLKLVNVGFAFGCLILGKFHQTNFFLLIRFSAALFDF